MRGSGCVRRQEFEEFIHEVEAQVAEATAPVEEKPTPKPSKVGPMIMILVVCLISNAVGAAVTWFLVGKSLTTLGETVAATVLANASGEPHGDGHESDEEAAEALEKGAVLPLEPFVVNLADADAARYLRIKVSLMVDDKTKIKELEENQALQLKVRDVILQILTGKTSQELIHEAGKNELRKQIQENIAKFFKEPKLSDVMFTEFVIQL